MTILWKKNTLLKADCFINSKLYHIFAIFSTHFCQHFPLLAFGTLYRFLTLPLWEPVLPLCAILRAKSRSLPMIDFLRLVGWNVVWHNFLCCSDICYTFARLYLFCRITENRKSSMAVVANRIPPIMCFCLDITRFFHPPYTLWWVPL